ncbi:MAG TPA: hypothetical protein VK576_00350 [Thermoleophilia bacterium]|nr:hypothetical protein [Thermoleophilia bacterium]
MTILPWDRGALDPPRRRLIVVGGVAAVVVLVVIVGAIATVGHRNRLTDDLTGDWRQPGAGSATHLSIEVETSPRPGTFQSDATGRLLIRGTIGDRPVSGTVDIPRLVLWGSPHATLLGERWTLRLDHPAQKLTVTSYAGQEIRLSRAP